MSEPVVTPFDRFDPDAVARSEGFIDAVAKGEPVEFSDVADEGDTGDRALAGLLEDWRDELRVPVPNGVCTELDAVAALGRGLAAHRRARRRMALVSAVAAAVLGVAGFGALMGQAQPGDTLYGVHTRVLGEPASVHDERIARSAQDDLDSVEQMITLGQWDEAQDKLAAVSDRVQTVKDNDRKQDLVERVNLLNAKVANRDPNATAVIPESAAQLGGRLRREKAWLATSRDAPEYLGVRRRLVERSVGVPAAIIPGDVGIRFGVIGRLVRTHGAVDQQLQQVRAQHVPVVVVVLLTLVATHHQSANTFVRQQCLVNRQVGQVGLDRHPLLGVKRLTGLHVIQRRRRVAWIVGEWIGRQTGREVVAHGSTLRSRAGIAPALDPQTSPHVPPPRARPTARVAAAGGRSR